MIHDLIFNMNENREKKTEESLSPQIPQQTSEFLLTKFRIQTQFKAFQNSKYQNRMFSEDYQKDDEFFTSD